MKSTQRLQRMHRIMAHADKIGRQAEAPLFDMANAVKNGDLEAMDRIVNDFQTAHHDCAEAARALCLLEALAPRLPLTKMRDKPRPSGRGRKARAPQVPLAV